MFQLLIAGIDNRPPMLIGKPARRTEFLWWPHLS